MDLVKFILKLSGEVDIWTW